MPERNTYRIHDEGSLERNSYKVVFEGRTPRPEFVSSGHATANPDDNIYRNAAGNWVVHGSVQNGQDAFEYNGKRLRVVVEFPDAMKVRVNDKSWLPIEEYEGDRLNQRTDWPSETGGGSDDTADESDDPHDTNRGHLLVIEGIDGGTDYTFSAGTLTGTEAKGGSLGWEDEIEGSNASGSVGGGRDAYEYWGGRSLSFNDPSKARVLLKKQGESSWEDITDQYRDDGSSGGGAEQPVDQPDDVSAPEVDDPVVVDGLRFDRVAHAVDDLGMDPNGGEDISVRLDRVADDHTLVRFPEGEFRFANQTIIEGATHFGIVGEGSDVTRFVSPRGFGERLIVRRGTGLKIEGIGLDQTAPGAHPGFWFDASDDLVVRDIALHGRGIHPNSTFDADSGNPEETNALSVGVTNSDGVGTVQDLHFVNGGQMRNKHHGNSRVGVWGLNAHRGTLDFVNCRVEEHPNNGFYTSSCPGVIRIRGGRIANNTVSQMRLATEGSVVEDATIVYDAAESNALDPMTPGHGTQGVAFDSGKVADGAIARNCRIEMRKHASGRGAVCVWGRSGHHEIHDCDIVVEEAAQSAGEAVSAISCEPPNFYDVEHGDASVDVSRVSITGSATTGESVFVRDRPLTLEEVCISQDRQAIRAKESTPGIRNSSLDAGSCPVRTDSDTTESSGASGGGPGSKRTVAITGQQGGGAKHYILRLKQGGTIKTTDRNEDPDFVEGPAAYGEVGTGTDEFYIDGDIAGFLTVGGPISVMLDGNTVEPWDIGDSVV